MSFDVDKYLLRVVWLISLIVTIGVLNSYAPAWPVLPFIPYGLTTVGVAVGAYLVSILGSLSYLTSKNQGLETALENSGNMQRFHFAITEPVKWGWFALLSTAAYFISTHYGYAPAIGAFEFMSISAVVTTAFAVLRNLHLISLFTTVTMQQSAEVNRMKVAFLHDLFSRVDAAEEEESSNKDTTVN
jgi:hypothetical protein